MTTLAIPPEIVGDTETIRERLALHDQRAANLARAIGSDLAEGYELTPGGYFARRLIEEWTAWDALVEEDARRRKAVALAHAIQPEETWWR